MRHSGRAATFPDHRLFSRIFTFVLVVAGWSWVAMPAHAASLIGSAQGTKLSTQGTPTSVTATLSAPATTGNMLIAVVGANGSTTIAGPSGWSTAINQAGTISQGIFYKRATGGETAVSASVTSNPGSIGIHVYEYSGATTFMSSGSSSGNSSAPASGSVTTTVANELIFAGFTVNKTTTYTDTSWNNAGEGFTERNDFQTGGGGATPDAAYAGGDNLANAAGAKTVTVAVANAGQWRGQIVRFQNDITAPAAVTDLALSGATTSSIDLTWTAPGDDGTVGIANTYDVRYSTSPIANDAAFNAATPASGEPAPLAAGTSQGMTVSGLSSSTLYYFAIKTYDDVSNLSGLSNVPSLATLAPPDVTAPAAVTDLVLSGATTSSIDLTWTAPGDDGNAGTAASYDIRRSNAPIASDADFNAATSLAGEPSPAVAGTVQTMTATGLSAGTTYYFAMKTSDEVPNVSALGNAPGLATLSPPDTTAPAAVADLALSGATTSSIVLTWTAPGDDGNVGTAALYDIHYSTSPILSDADYAAATDVTPGSPAPAVAGTVQTMTATGLTAATTYYFAIKTYDEVSNISALGNSPGLATLTPPDTTAPAAVTDLALSGATTSSIDLTWTAPGDDGATGTAASYDIRYSASPITDGNFASAAPVAGEPAPAVAGTVQSMTVSGLSAGTTYYFAIKTYDDVSNLSGLSNVPSLATLTPADVTAPAAVTDLALSGATTSSIVLTWTAPGDDGATGTAALYDIRYSDEYSIGTDVIYAGATQVVGEPAPAVAGTVQTMTVTGLTPNRTYNFAIKTYDEAPNLSGLSNSPSLATLPLPDTTAPAAVTTLALSGATTSSIVLTWTAPGDDGASGTAASYDIRYSTSSIADGNFAAATQVAGEPAPAVAGTVQTMTVTGLASATTYYFAIKTADEVPNVSALSNVPSLSTLVSPDVTAPAAVTTLALSGATTSSIVLTWTAPGDDGASGTAASYDIRYSTSSIADGNFAAATQVAGEPAPAVAGTVQTMTVTGLASATTYYFAIKTADEVPNVSALSNVPSLSTLAAADTTAPDAITTLAVTGNTSDSVSLSWIATGDDGAVGTAASYDLRYSTSSISNTSDFDLATPVAGEPVPAVAGTIQTMTVSGLTEGTTYFFAIRASDDAANVSALSNVVSASVGERRAYGTPLELSGVADLVLSVAASPTRLPAGGGMVTFTYTVVNKGAQHVADVSVIGDLGGTDCSAVEFLGGDSDLDRELDTESRETWTFTCVAEVVSSATHTAIARGYWNYGYGTSNAASVSIIVGAVAASANVHFHVQPFPAVLHAGGGVSTLRYHVGNLGATPVTDVRFSGDFCELSGPYAGDANGNDMIDTGEHWEYECVGTFVASTTLTIVFTGKAGDTDISDVARVPIDVGSAEPHANIHLHVAASPARLPMGGGTVFLTYHVSNDGNVPLTDVALTSGSESCVYPTYVGGDQDRDSVLDLDEIWTYECVEFLVATEADAPSVSAKAEGRTVVDDALFIVPVALVAAIAADPTAEGAYDVSVALASTPDIDTDLGLVRSTRPTACVPGVAYKLESDLDPDTQVDSTVYYCGIDGYRHAFPNEKTYRSWYLDFSGVRVIKADVLAGIPLGKPVTYRPGMRMLKVPSDPRTYAVSRGGLLRWVPTEAIAAELYGPAWKRSIQDLSEAFLPLYRFGEPVPSEGADDRSSL